MSRKGNMTARGPANFPPASCQKRDELPDACARPAGFQFEDLPPPKRGYSGGVGTCIRIWCVEERVDSAQLPATFTAWDEKSRITVEIRDKQELLRLSTFIKDYSSCAAGDGRTVRGKTMYDPTFREELLAEITNRRRYPNNYKDPDRFAAKLFYCTLRWFGHRSARSEGAIKPAFQTIRDMDALIQRFGCFTYPPDDFIIAQEPGAVGGLSPIYPRENPASAPVNPAGPASDEDKGDDEFQDALAGEADEGNSPLPVGGGFFGGWFGRGNDERDNAGGAPEPNAHVEVRLPPVSPIQQKENTQDTMEVEDKRSRLELFLRKIRAYDASRDGWFSPLPVKDRIMTIYNANKTFHEQVILEAERRKLLDAARVVVTVVPGYLYGETKNERVATAVERQAAEARIPDTLEEIQLDALLQDATELVANYVDSKLWALGKRTRTHLERLRVEWEEQASLPTPRPSSATRKRPAPAAPIVGTEDVQVLNQASEVQRAEIQRLQRELERARRDGERLRGELDDARAGPSDDVTQQLGHLQAQLNDCRLAHAQVQNDLAMLQLDHDAVAARAQVADEEAAAALADARTLRAEIQATERAHRVAETEAENLVHEHERRKHLVDGLTQRLRQDMTPRPQRPTAATAGNARLEKALSDLDATSQRLAQAQENEARLRAELNELTSEEQRVRALVQLAREEAEDARATLAEIEEERETLVTHRRDCDQRLRECEDARRAAETSADDALAQRTTAMRRLDALHALMGRLHALVADANNQMDVGELCQAYVDQDVLPEDAPVVKRLCRAIGTHTSRLARLRDESQRDAEALQADLRQRLEQLERDTARAREVSEANLRAAQEQARQLQVEQNQIRAEFRAREAELTERLETGQATMAEREAAMNQLRRDRDQALQEGERDLAEARHEAREAAARIERQREAVSRFADCTARGGQDCDQHIEDIGLHDEEIRRALEGVRALVRSEADERLRALRAEISDLRIEEARLRREHERATDEVRNETAEVQARLRREQEDALRRLMDEKELAERRMQAAEDAKRTAEQLLVREREEHKAVLAEMEMARAAANELRLQMIAKTKGLVTVAVRIKCIKNNHKPKTVGSFVVKEEEIDGDPINTVSMKCDMKTRDPVEAEKYETRGTLTSIQRKAKNMAVFDDNTHNCGSEAATRTRTDMDFYTETLEKVLTSSSLGNVTVIAYGSSGAGKTTAMRVLTDNLLLSLGKTGAGVQRIVVESVDIYNNVATNMLVAINEPLQKIVQHEQVLAAFMRSAQSTLISNPKTTINVIIGNDDTFAQYVDVANFMSEIAVANDKLDLQIDIQNPRQAVSEVVTKYGRDGGNPLMNIITEKAKLIKAASARQIKETVLDATDPSGLLKEFDRVMKHIAKLRPVTMTPLNVGGSSRSHMILKLRISFGGGTERNVVLVDLAGSEDYSVIDMKQYFSELATAGAFVPTDWRLTTLDNVKRESEFINDSLKNLVGKLRDINQKFLAASKSTAAKAALAKEGTKKVVSFNPNEALVKELTDRGALGEKRIFITLAALRADEDDLKVVQETARTIAELDALVPSDAVMDALSD